MKTDAIFRLASTTKIVTSVAVMQLMEEGRLLVTDPVSKYIPQFKSTMVAIPAPSNAPPGAPPFTVVPAKRQITIHDVLTKTPGISYPSGPTRSLYEDAGFHQWYFADNTVPMCTMIEKLPGLPFQAQPGDRWMNGYTADILGCIIEKISGQTLDTFMRTRIFQPLKMNDTHFFVPKDKASRLAAVYAATDNGGIKRADGKWTDGQGDYVDGPRVAFSGGAGLLTTAADYARFLQMLLNGGELDGVRLLSPKTVELMTSNHIGNLYKNGQMGFGFNVEVSIQRGLSDRLGSVGDYGWQGAYFPRFLVDPTERLVAIFMAQLTPYGGASDLHDKFLNGVYQALVKPANKPPALPTTDGR
jgi:CubicO group peptidase (beta-lactamase class C family)